MRKLFLFIAALAALLTLSISANATDGSALPPVFVPPPVAPPAGFWTGFYIGGNLGGGWDQRSVTDNLFGLNFGNTRSSFIGGGQVGYNYQFSNVVLGIEADIDWAGNNNTDNGFVIPRIGTVRVTFNDGSFSTLAARFGVTYKQWLFYGKAGGGWVGNNNLTITNVANGASFTSSNTNINSGWLVGAGIEWALAPHWSVKIEYNYLGLNSGTFIVPAGVFLAVDTFATSNPNVQMAKIGINYLFNGGGSY